MIKNYYICAQRIYSVRVAFLECEYLEGRTEMKGRREKERERKQGREGEGEGARESKGGRGRGRERERREKREERRERVHSQECLAVYTVLLFHANIAWVLCNLQLN